ncbi:interleukin-23 receptor [Pelobates cultripes]|uniref:Interleukin-23 receptor n=1 Tax=Pelobates cultripes TaxID=61616 RepID=A0AAD1SSY2_PELCU|nr:interleukin-23 receptor [Pelobates cultripes]
MGICSLRWELAYLVYTFIIEPCAAFGQCSGYVTARPSTVVPVGSNISIICVSTESPCRSLQTFSMTLNNDDPIRPHWMNQTMARHDLYEVTKIYDINCFFKCLSRTQIVCWKTVYVGYPPDSPFNISCSSDENSTVMMCTWEKGRKTLIGTSYIVHVKNLQTLEENIFYTDDGITMQVNRLQDKDFSIYITASNELGNSTSQPAQVVLEDIVVPTTPEMTMIEIQNMTFKIDIRWRKAMAGTDCFCELAFQTEHDADWSTTGKHKINEEKSNIFTKIILECTAWRVRCKEEKGLGYWSKWSVPRYIPQTEPHEKFKVWRVLGQVNPDGNREVTVLIKPSDPEPSWARTLGYKVFYKDRDTEILIQTCNKTQLQCGMLVPKGIETISFKAYNSYGSSTSSHISLRQDNNVGFTAPRNVTVTSGLLKYILVQWEPPERLESELRWFIIQWDPNACGGNKQNISWEIVPKNTTQFIIEGKIEAGQLVTIFLYAVYDAGISQSSINHGYIQELKPNEGPRDMQVSFYGAKTVIWWDEVPLCKRNGIVTHYTLYMKEISNGSVTQIVSPVRHYSKYNLNPDLQYEICISASTRAGDGPADQCLTFQPDHVPQNYMGMLIGVIFTTLVVVSFVFTLMFKKKIRERIKIYIVSMIPKCLHETYPRIENSRILKYLQANAEMPWFDLITLHCDPEIIEVEEVAPTKPTNDQVTAKEYGKVMQKDDIDIPEQVPGYRPQIARAMPRRNDSYCAPPLMLDIQTSQQRWDNGNNCVDENILLWSPASVTNEFVFQEMELLISDIEGDDISRFFRASPNVPADHKQEGEVPESIMRVQSLLGDQHTLCLTGDFSNSDSYFPQMMAKGHKDQLFSDSPSSQCNNS